jgi:hypothetical protein
MLAASIIRAIARHFSEHFTKSKRQSGNLPDTEEQSYGNNMIRSFVLQLHHGEVQVVMKTMY